LPDDLEMALWSLFKIWKNFTHKHLIEGGGRTANKFIH
jgi:hypothetical protein